MGCISKTRRRERRPGAMIVIGLVPLAAALVATTGVYAALSAQAVATDSVSSGTLNLVQAADGGVGFSIFVGTMAPADQHNVYVNLSNTGSLATATGMRLWIGAVPATTLTNGVAVGEGLTVRISSCSVPWTLATGVCSGLATVHLAATAVSTLNTAATARALANVPALAATTGKVGHVQVTLGLVGTEKSVNGVPPVPTVQGLASTLTFSFTVQQRLGTKTNQ
jgi:hypothetical protein